MKNLVTLFLITLGIAHAETKPNVLFLAVDDMNDWIGCLEDTEPLVRPRAVTPNIDKLAARGVNFTNAHTAGVFCAPSRSAIFSGQFASTTGCYTTAHYFVNRPETEALQTSFAKGGYTTLGAGKLFHHPTGAIDQRDWTEFFLRNRSQRENGWPLDSWSEETPFPVPFPASIYNHGKKVTGGLFLEWGAIPEGKEEEMADTQRVNWAVEQLKKDHDKPFFLACGIYAPHFPNYCPQKYFDLYDPKSITPPPYKEDDLEDLPEKIKKQKTARRNLHHRGLEKLDAIDDAIHGYLACISYADAMMGRVLDALEASPYADNTIVVLWSDHGYHHGEKGHWGKHTLWERTSNVPFIWAGPGVSEGAKTDVTVSLIDIYPTLVEMCDLPLPQQELEGTSIAATLEKPSAAKDRDVFLPYIEPGEYAIINRDWRYIRYGEDGEELYDLKKDPNEWTNLSNLPEFAEQKAAMESLAPKTFAEPEVKLNARKDLLLEGATFRWKTGAGNASPESGYVPPTTDPGSQESSGEEVANLVRNSSFEAPAGKPSAWRLPQEAYQISTQQKAQGKQSLSSKKGIAKGVAAHQKIKIEPNQSFEFSYRIFFENGSEGRVVFDTLDRFDETAQVIMDASRSGKWLHFDGKFSSGDHHNVTLRFFPIDGFRGRFFVDDVQLHSPSGASTLKQASAASQNQSSLAANRKVDTSTLTGKVMCGYQGWFNCDEDGTDLGWKHWAQDRQKQFGPGNVTVDLWPDVSEFDADELFPTGFQMKDGSRAKVFSSYNRKTVMRHFKWMQDYGIDGAFLQRFANGLKGNTLTDHKDVVLSHVREGSQQSGRAYAIMYDLSGIEHGGTSMVKEDWLKLRAQKITSDSSYLHHEGKPLVSIWGVGFSDEREYTLDESRDLIEFLKENGCAVMVGVPFWWRDGGRDSTEDPERLKILGLADVISPWSVSRYHNPKQVAELADRVLRHDLSWCQEREIDFLPVVFPGFSWFNLYGDEMNKIPRLKGQFLWSQFVAAKSIGCEMIYVAMFDEVDEGTAIFKCTNDVPVGDGVSFLGLEGLPSDYYLRLTGAGGKLLRGEIPLDSELPAP